MNNKRKILLVLLAIIFISILGVVIIINNRNSNSSGKIKVLASTTQLTDFIKNIAGDKIELKSIFTPNIDPHEYELLPENIKDISESDLIVINGLGLEKKLNKSLETASARIIKASNYIDSIKFQEDDSELDEDPHIWFSVTNVKSIVSGISDELIKRDNKNASFYKANRDDYINRLDELDNYIREKVSELPENSRKFVSNHDAFGYFIKDYGFEFVGSVIPSLSTETQPSPKDTAELIKKIKEEGVKAIFTENSINPKLSGQIAAEVNIKIISNLYGDTLGEPGSKGDTYLKMMKFNTDTIVTALKN